MQSFIKILIYKLILQVISECIARPATTFWSVSHRCKIVGFMQHTFFSNIFPECFQNLAAFLAKFSYFKALPFQPHRPNNLSTSNVKHKGVEEPIYRCCTLYALRRRCNISGYLMSLLKGCDYFTSNKTCFIT